jgi:hypothetical protein
VCLWGARRQQWLAAAAGQVLRVQGRRRRGSSAGGAARPGQPWAWARLQEGRRPGQGQAGLPHGGGSGSCKCGARGQSRAALKWQVWPGRRGAGPSRRLSSRRAGPARGARRHGVGAPRTGGRRGRSGGPRPGARQTWKVGVRCGVGKVGREGHNAAGRGAGGRKVGRGLGPGAQGAAGLKGTSSGSGGAVLRLKLPLPRRAAPRRAAPRRRGPGRAL